MSSSIAEQVVINSKPPIYDRAKKQFNFNPNGVVFAYSPVIYNPSGTRIPDHLVIHEQTHIKQQNAIGGPEIWWERYLAEPEFRLSQELEAYHAQYEYIKTLGWGRQKEFEYLRFFGKTLAEMYDLDISGYKAMELIKKYV